MSKLMDFKDIKKEYDSLNLHKIDYKYKNSSKKIILFSDIKKKYNEYLNSLKIYK